MLRALRTALVVPHDRAAAPARIDIDAVDHAPQPDLVRDLRHRASPPAAIPPPPRTRTAARGPRGSPSTAVGRLVLQVAPQIGLDRPQRRGAHGLGPARGDRRGLLQHDLVEDPQRVAERLRRDRAARAARSPPRAPRACSCRAQAGPGQARAAPVRAHARPATSPGSRRSSRARRRRRPRGGGHDRARPLPSAVRGPPPRPPAAAACARASSRSVGATAGSQTTSASSRPAPPLGPLGHEQLGEIGEERRGQREVALLVGAAVAEDDLLGRSRHARIQQVALAVQRASRSAPAASPEASASSWRCSSDRNGSPTPASGNSPSFRPQTNTARKRRARIASGSESSTAPARTAVFGHDLEPIEQLQQLGAATVSPRSSSSPSAPQQRRQRASVEFLVSSQQRRRTAVRGREQPPCMPARARGPDRRPPRAHRSRRAPTPAARAPAARREVPPGERSSRARPRPRGARAGLGFAGSRAGRPRALDRRARRSARARARSDRARCG